MIIFRVPLCTFTSPRRCYYSVQQYCARVVAVVQWTQAHMHTIVWESIIQLLHSLHNVLVFNSMYAVHRWANTITNWVSLDSLCMTSTNYGQLLTNSTPTQAATHRQALLCACGYTVHCTLIYMYTSYIHSYCIYIYKYIYIYIYMNTVW